MKYYVSLLALGDNLISLSLLDKLDYKINILGTKYTKNIAKLIEKEDKFNIEIIYDKIPAFYDIKKQGKFKAIKEFYSFVKYIKKNNIDELIFEKKDFRSSLVSFFTNVKVSYPNTIESKVYKNRKELIEKCYEQDISLNSYKLNLNIPKKIVINPLTRELYRNIKHEHLTYMIDSLVKYGYEIYLIDIEKKYTDLEKKVEHYLTNTTLEDVKNLINNCDLYIGGDSFLIHLAYYLKKNYFMVFYRDNDYFLPLNIEESFYIKAHNSDDIKKELDEKFKNIGLVK